MMSLSYHLFLFWMGGHGVEPWPEISWNFSFLLPIFYCLWWIPLDIGWNPKIGQHSPKEICLEHLENKFILIRPAGSEQTGPAWGASHVFFIFFTAYTRILYPTVHKTSNIHTQVQYLHTRSWNLQIIINAFIIHRMSIQLLGLLYFNSLSFSNISSDRDLVDLLSNEWCMQCIIIGNESLNKNKSPVGITNILKGCSRMKVSFGTSPKPVFMSIQYPWYAVQYCLEMVSLAHRSWGLRNEDLISTHLSNSF